MNVLIVVPWDQEYGGVASLVGLFKSVSVREVRAGFPEVRKQLWVESFRKMDILCGPWGIQVEASCGAVKDVLESPRRGGLLYNIQSQEFGRTGDRNGNAVLVRWLITVNGNMNRSK